MRGAKDSRKLAIITEALGAKVLDEIELVEADVMN